MYMISIIIYIDLIYHNLFNCKTFFHISFLKYFFPNHEVIIKKKALRYKAGTSKPGTLKLYLTLGATLTRPDSEHNFTHSPRQARRD